MYVFHCIDGLMLGIFFTTVGEKGQKYKGSSVGFLPFRYDFQKSWYFSFFSGGALLFLLISSFKCIFSLDRPGPQFIFSFFFFSSWVFYFMRRKSSGWPLRRFSPAVCSIAVCTCPAATCPIHIKGSVKYEQICKKIS